MIAVLVLALAGRWRGTAARRHADAGARLATLIRRRPVTCYLVLAYLGMWACLTPAFVTDLPVRPLSALGALVGLALPAVLVAHVTGGPAGVRDLVGRIVRRPPRPGTYLVALAGVPALSVALSVALAGLVNGLRPTDLWRSNGFTVAGLFLLETAWALLTIQLLEELGWTGTVHDRLQRRHGAFRAALLVAPAFAGIHLPLYLLGSPVTWVQVARVSVQLAAVVVFAGFLRVLLAWTYNAAGASVLPAALLHASFNTASGREFLQHLGAGPVRALLPLAAVALLAVAVTALTRGRLGPAGGLQAPRGWRGPG
jgi:uncharacterized protein